VEEMTPTDVSVGSNQTIVVLHHLLLLHDIHLTVAQMHPEEFN